MKGEKVRVIIIYFLFLILLGLIGYLIYFIYENNNETKTPKKQTTNENVKKEENTKECEFSITLDKFNELYNNAQALQLCEGNNKLSITDIVLQNNAVDTYVIFYNGNSADKDAKNGIYINNNQIVSGASQENKNIITINDNLMFIKKEDNSNFNLIIYNSNGQKIYDLAQSLENSKIEDPILKELSKTNKNITDVVSANNIDKDSLNFAAGSFTFNTIVKETGQKGSTYTVIYSEEKFQNPALKTN